MSTRTSHLVAALSLVGVTFTWGVSFPAIQYALRAGMDVEPFMLLRFLMAAASLGVICLVRRTHFPRRLLILAGLLGIADYLAFWFQTDGLRFTTSSKSAFVTTFYVLLTPMITLCFGEKLKRGEMIAVPLAMLGLYGLFWTAAAPLSLGDWNRGDTETFFCAISFAIVIVAVARLSRQYDVLALTLVQIAVTVICAFVAMAIRPPADLAQQLTLAMQPGVLLSIVFCGVFATAIAFWVQCLMQARLAATEAALFFSLEPVFATVIAVMGWVPGVQESMSFVQFGGGALILLAALTAATDGLGLLPKASAARAG